MLDSAVDPFGTLNMKKVYKIHDEHSKHRPHEAARAAGVDVFGVHRREITRVQHDGVMIIVLLHALARRFTRQHFRVFGRYLSLGPSKGEDSPG